MKVIAILFCKPVVERNSTKKQSNTLTLVLNCISKKTFFNFITNFLKLHKNFYILKIFNRTPKGLWILDFKVIPLQHIYTCVEVKLNLYEH